MKRLIFACDLYFREVLELVRDLDPPGRFLRKIGPDSFVEVPLRVAKEKVCQTLRDAVSDVTAAATRNETSTTSTGRQEELDNVSDDDEEEDEKMPPLSIGYKHKIGKPQTRAHSKRKKSSVFAKYSVGRMSPRSSLVSPDKFIPRHDPDKTTPKNQAPVCPDKIISRHAPATVTPTNQVGTSSSLFGTSSHIFTNVSSQPIFISGFEMGYDAYNYLSRVGTQDDFDLFDGQLIESAKNDEVFASVRL